MKAEFLPGFYRMNVSVNNDDYWIKRIVNDVSEFDVIYDRYITPIYKYVIRRIPNKFEAEDITANIFLTALESIVEGKYQCNNHFASWLFTIARRRIADYYRKPAEYSLDAVIPSEYHHVSAVDGNENYEELQSHYSKLNNYEQDLLALRFSAQLDYKKIAQIVNKSVCSVKMATYRALRKLRKNMRGEGHEG